MEDVYFGQAIPDGVVQSKADCFLSIVWNFEFNVSSLDEEKNEPWEIGATLVFNMIRYML